MAKKNRIYVTTMYRFANRERHSYVIFAGFRKHAAIRAGEDEIKYRGGKYYPEVLEFIPGVCGHVRCALGLEEQYK